MGRLIAEKMLGKTREYIDKDYDIGGGDMLKVRIFKPSVSDWNWFQSEVAAAVGAAGGKVNLPPDIYADIVIRGIYDPETGQKAFTLADRDSIRDSSVQAFVQMANDWIGMLLGKGAEEVSKNSVTPSQGGGASTE